MSFDIQAYRPEFRPQIIALSLRAWEPVFTALQPAVQAYVYDAFFPNGWAARQTFDVEQVLQHEPDNVWVAVDGGTVLGWLGLRLHPLDQMGEVRIIAVDPIHQRQGIATALMEHATSIMRHQGMKMVMVETGDDPGHAPARAAYEHAGFQRWPVARYFREL